MRMTFYIMNSHTGAYVCDGYFRRKGFDTTIDAKAWMKERRLNRSIYKVGFFAQNKENNGIIFKPVEGGLTI